MTQGQVARGASLPRDAFGAQRLTVVDRFGVSFDIAVGDLRIAAAAQWTGYPGTGMNYHNIRLNLFAVACKT
jgi:hypothetical protein